MTVAEIIAKHCSDWTQEQKNAIEADIIQYGEECAKEARETTRELCRGD